MKKSFLSAVVMALVLTVSIAAPLKSEAASHQQIRKAAEYYRNTLVDGFLTGFRISSGKNISAAKRMEIRKLAEKFIVETVLPTLQKKDLIDLWVAAQNDPEIIQLNEQALKAENINDLQNFMQKAMIVMNKKYSDLLKLDSDPQYVNELMKFIEQAAAVIRQP